MMNGIETITARILADAGTQAEEIAAQAQAQADELRARARARAREQAEAILEKGRQDAEQRRQRQGSVTQLEARKLVLEAKQQMVSRAFSGALEALSRYTGTEAVELLARLAASASTTGTEEVLLRPEDRQSIGPQVVSRANEILAGGRLTLAEETRPMAGGVVLRSGPVETNCTFETLVQLRRQELSAPVAKLLFG